MFGGVGVWVLGVLVCLGVWVFGTLAPTHPRTSWCLGACVLVCLGLSHPRTQAPTHFLSVYNSKVRCPADEGSI
jgi:hypothetical protein